MSNAFLWLDALPDREFAYVMLLGLLVVCTVFTLALGRLFRRMPTYRMPFDYMDDQRRNAENGKRAHLGRRL